MKNLLKFSILSLLVHQATLFGMIEAPQDWQPLKPLWEEISYSRLLYGFPEEKDQLKRKQPIMNHEFSRRQNFILKSEKFQKAGAVVVNYLKANEIPEQWTDLVSAIIDSDIPFCKEEKRILGMDPIGPFYNGEDFYKEKEKTLGTKIIAVALQEVKNRLSQTQKNLSEKTTKPNFVKSLNQKLKEISI